MMVEPVMWILYATSSYHLVQSGNSVLAKFVHHNGNQICHESEDHDKVCAPFNGRPGKGLWDFMGAAWIEPDVRLPLC